MEHLQTQMAAQTLMSLPAEVRMLIWRYTVPAVEVKIVYARSSEPDGPPLFGPVEVRMLPRNPALPVMLVCHQTATELLSIPTYLTAHVDSTDYPWWLHFTTPRYKRHFNIVKIRFQRKASTQAAVAALASRRSDHDIKSNFKRYWRNVEILRSSMWTFSENLEASFSSRFTAECTVELRLSEAIKLEIEDGGDTVDEDWESSSLGYMDGTVD